MKARSAELLRDILEAGQVLVTGTADLSYEDFLAEVLRKSGVYYQFMVIGEALTLLAKTDPLVFEAIPKARKAIGLRNVLAHEYAVISDRLIWKILTNDLLPLLAAVRAALATS